ncbi:MAG: hypothetical protein HY855_18245 [Burkholderiales bacterium]|nr:hypothetical protein [Burkholderiales bacterium]
MIRRTLELSMLLAAASAQGQTPASAPPPPAATPGGVTVYRCPGPDGPHYTNALTPAEARDRGCRTIEGTPITVVQMPKARPPASGTAAAKPGDARVDPNAQRERDNDARRILEAELRREEDKLAALRREYNNGEPERRGDERNYQTYLDRVSALKASITRSESDIAAIKREIAKIP